jgi:hypothetical protein
MTTCLPDVPLSCWTLSLFFFASLQTMIVPTVLLHRPVHLLTAFASLLLLGTLLHLRPNPRHVSSALDEISKRPVFEIEGLPLGDSFRRSRLATDADPLPWLIESLKARFLSTMSSEDVVTPGYPTCKLDLRRYTHIALESAHPKVKIQPSERLSVISIAINLRNSEAIVPAQAVALLEAISYLLPKNKVYVSVYENDSQDKTRRLLSDFGAALQAIGVDGLWMRSSNMRSAFDTQDRIIMLAEIRNHAIAPLMPYASGGTNNDTLLFMNDVVTCASDILELIHQQRLHNAGMTFGMDWDIVDRHVREGEAGYIDPNSESYDPNNPPRHQIPRFYDTWVGRGISGNLVYPWASPSGFAPASSNESWVADAYLLENETVHQRWLDGRAIPAYSGWGGMSAFDASLFTREHLRFRSSNSAGWTGGSQAGALGSWGHLVSSKGYLESDCLGASECEYIARDIWNLRQHDARIVLAPQARTTYNIPAWQVVSEMVPVTRREGPSSLEDDDLIDWSETPLPQSVVCIPSRTKEGASVWPWDGDNIRKTLNSMWKPEQNTTTDDTSQEDDSEPEGDSESVKRLERFIAKHDGDIQAIQDACEAMGCTAELRQVIEQRFGSKR